MQKIDRLGWAAGMSFVCHGARIGIRTNDPAVLERLPPHLPPGWRPVASPLVDTLYSLRVGGQSARPGMHHYHLLYRGTERQARTLGLNEVFESLESQLHFSIALKARRKLFAHAGVVGWRGQAIVIPGRSLSGKTRLVAALVRAGAVYYSDEYAVFDRQGRVHPYPKPLSIREENGDPRKKWLVGELGGRSGTKPLPVGLITVTEYKPGTRWRPRVLSPGQALLALLANTVLAQRRPQLALTTLRRAVRCALALKGKRDEAEDVVASLLGQLAKESVLVP
jgi:hypothetical protein